MYHWLKLRLVNFLSIFGLGLIRDKELTNLRTLEISAESFEIDFELGTRMSQLSDIEKYRNSRNKSKSALRQDLLCLLVNDWKKNGYFVEFGACNGNFVSNTFILEKSFGWTGILSEPGRNWHPELRLNRNCIIDYRAVWEQSDLKLSFYEMEAPGLSRIKSGIPMQHSPRLRKKYFVTSVTLEELLTSNGAPKIIDYLSVDTEGSEFEILAQFDFKKFTFNFVSIEHNFESRREQIYQVMINNGYVRILSDISKYEDWFVPMVNLPRIEKSIKLDAASGLT